MKSLQVKKAIDAFRKEHMNCAQSVLRGFEGNHLIEKGIFIQAKAWGRGRAHEGCCGALYAALELTQDFQHKQSIRRLFAEKAGSEKCREIRGKKQLTCMDCVELAARLLDG